MRKLILVAGFCTLAAPVLAQTATGNHTGAGGHDACKQKIEALCPGVQPGGGRIMACLKKQNKTLEEVCPGAARHHPAGGNRVQSPTGPAPVAQPPATQP